MVKFHRMSNWQVEDKLETYKRKLSKLNDDDSVIMKFDKNIENIKADYTQYIEDCPYDVQNAETVKNNKLKASSKKKFNEVRKKLEILFNQIKDLQNIRDEIQRRSGKKVKQRTRKEEQERKLVIEKILREKIPLRQKLEKLEDILDEKERKRLVFCIEDVDDIERYMLSDNDKHMEFGVDNRWRARFFRRPKDLIFLRLSLCMKIVHTAWKGGDFESSINLFRNGKMSDEDGEGIFNYKKGTLTYKGILYNILPESPDLIDSAFDAHEGLFEKWKDFDKLFNINGVKCIPDKDKCVSSEPRICMSHKDIIMDMDYHCLRPHYYFPTYAYIHSGNVPKF